MPSFLLRSAKSPLGPSTLVLSSQTRRETSALAICLRGVGPLQQLDPNGTSGTPQPLSWWQNLVICIYLCTQRVCGAGRPRPGPQRSGIVGPVARLTRLGPPSPVPPPSAGLAPPPPPRPAPLGLLPLALPQPPLPPPPSPPWGAGGARSPVRGSGGAAAGAQGPGRGPGRGRGGWGRASDAVGAQAEHREGGTVLAEQQPDLLVV